MLPLSALPSGGVLLENLLGLGHFVVCFCSEGKTPLTRSSLSFISNCRLQSPPYKLVTEQLITIVGPLPNLIRSCSESHSPGVQEMLELPVLPRPCPLLAGTKYAFTSLEQSGFLMAEAWSLLGFVAVTSSHYFTFHQWSLAT